MSTWLSLRKIYTRFVIVKPKSRDSKRNLDKVTVQRIFLQTLETGHILEIPVSLKKNWKLCFRTIFKGKQRV